MKYSFIKNNVRISQQIIEIFFCLLFFCFVVAPIANGQEVIYKDKPRIVTKNNTDGFDEIELRKKMKNEGLSEPVIDKLILMRKELFEKGKNVEWTNIKRGGTPPVINAICTGMSAENGWGTYKGAVGVATSSGPAFGTSTNPPPFPNFAINTGGNIPCTPGPNPPLPPNNGAIPRVAPGFGNASIQLGQNQTPGAVAEQLTYQITVTPQDTNFIYAYAILMENPGHSSAEQPFVEFCMYDQNGGVVNCGCFKYVASNGLPGFYESSCSSLYKPWTLVGVNLSNYIGQTINVVITNVDCSQGGHYAQSYWDFACGSLSGSNTPFCMGQQTTLCGPVDPNINYSYQWYQNHHPYTGPPSGTAQCITPTPLSNDTFSVKAQIGNCSFYLVHTPRAIITTPTFTFTGTCGNFTFTDASTSSDGSPMTSWNWSFPGGSPSSSTIKNPIVTYPAGTYTVTLTVTSQSGCTNTIVRPITITGLPVAAFSNTTVCQGDSTRFTDNSIPGTGDPIEKWNWTFSGGNLSTAQNPSVAFPVAGNYTATLTVTSHLGCTDIVTQSINVNPLPVSNFSATAVCFNNATVFTDQSTGGVTQWEWDVDNNGSIDYTTQNPSHTYTAPASYTVTLITTNNFNCKNTISHNVVVNPLPVVNFNSTTVCFGDSTCFTDMSTILTGTITAWSWNFDDPNSSSANVSNLKNPCHKFTIAGTFSVTLTVTSNNGCQSTIILPVSVNPLPIVNFSTNSVCFNTPSTQFTNLSSGATLWSWNFGDIANNTSVLQNPSHAYTAAGNYTATLTATTQFSCTNIFAQTVTVNPVPIVSFSVTTVCFNNSNVFTNLSTNGTTQWNFGDGNFSTLQSPSHTYNASGNYNVTLVVTNNFGCKDSVSLNTIVHPLPVANFSSTTVCLGSATCFADKSTITYGSITSWSWNFGDVNLPGNISYLQNPCITYTASGTYTVILTTTSNNGCQSTSILSAKVNPIPIAAFTFSDVCLNTAMNFTNTSINATQWNWDFGDGNTSTSQNPSNTYLGYGTYIVTLMVISNGGCKNTITDTVTVFMLPVVKFVSDSVCVKDTTSFIDLSFISSGSIINRDWNFGDPASDTNNVSTLKNPTHVFSSAGNFMVTLAVTSNNNCISSVVLPVVVFPLPVADFNSDPIGPMILLTDDITFKDLSVGSVVQWNWDFGDGNTSSKQHPLHIYNDTGTYIVTLNIMSDRECRDTVQHPLRIKDYVFYMPNTFTPNGDGINDFFFGQGTGVTKYEMFIFDRWGNLIFYCNVDELPQLPPCVWDGKVSGGISNERVQQDVYVWKVKLKNILSKEFTFIGHVNVIK
ncbi:MAG: PKD domain-containing protein [Bacteroidota bacterium]